VQKKNNTPESRSERRRSTKSTSEQNTAPSHPQKVSNLNEKPTTKKAEKDKVKDSQLISTKPQSTAVQESFLPKERLEKSSKKKSGEKRTSGDQKKFPATKSVSKQNTTAIPPKKKVERTTSTGEKAGGGVKNFEQKYELFKQKWKAEKEKRRLMKDSSGGDAAQLNEILKLPQEKRSNTR